MGRYIGPACKRCRRQGMKLFLKGDRCYTGKCAMECRSGNPGQHGQGRSKNSEYGLQLREKQKAKRYYGVRENLLKLLELRLDNVIYRLGFAMSRAEARQLVTHGHFTVNGRKVNIPSYLVKPGMVITLKDSSRSLEKIKSSVEANAFRQPPKWLEYDANNMVAKVVGVPEREDIDLPIEEHLIARKPENLTVKCTSSSSCTPSNTPVRLVS